MVPYLGIEIGGTKLQLGVGPGDGSITRLVRLPVEPRLGAQGIRSQIVLASRDLLSGVAAVGIGFGGPVDVGRGIVLKSNQIDGWDGFPLADWVRTTLGIESVTLQNDADTAALGEALFGAGRGLSPVLYVNSGSGIGGGLIIDGKIYRGSGHGAIEIGHLWMLDGVEPQSLEMIASGWSIARKGQSLPEEEIVRGWDSGGILAEVAGNPSMVTAATVALAARRQPQGDAARILEEAARIMGHALAHAVTLLAPRRIILGGGVSLIDEDLWLNPIRKALHERVFGPFRGTYDVVTATLGEDVVVHGALALARQVSSDLGPQ